MDHILTNLSPFSTTCLKSSITKIYLYAKTSTRKCQKWIKESGNVLYYKSTEHISSQTKQFVLRIFLNNHVCLLFQLWLNVQLTSQDTNQFWCLIVYTSFLDLEFLVKHFCVCLFANHLCNCQGFKNAISLLYQNNKFPNNCVTVKSTMKANTRPYLVNYIRQMK